MLVHVLYARIQSVLGYPNPFVPEQDALLFQREFRYMYMYINPLQPLGTSVIIGMTASS